MKFVLTQSHVFWWPITVRVPDPEVAGKIISQTFEMQFEAKSRDDAIASQERYAACATDRERADTEVATLRDTCRGWRGIVDEDGIDVPFTDETFALACGQSWFRTGVMAAIAESAWGKEARMGN